METKMNIPRQVTDADKLASKHIAVLLIVAKTLAKAVRDARSSQTDEEASIGASKDYAALIQAAHSFFPNGEMEQEVIKFARLLGFEVEQQYVGNASKTKQ